MNFFFFVFQRSVLFFVAIIPLIMAFLLLKTYKLSPKATAIILFITLLLSVFFWIKLKDISLVVYQGVPYLSSFIVVWAENVLIKKRASNQTEDHS